MNIMSYADCCAFKIAHDNYLYSKHDCEHICSRTFSHKEVRDQEHNSVGPNVNNRVLIAVNQEQLDNINLLKKYIKEKQYNINVKCLTSFINQKTGNNVRLYMVYRSGSLAKSSAA